MRYLIPLRHGKGALSLVTVIVLGLIIAFVTPYLAFAGKPLLISWSLRTLLVLLLLLAWVIYYLLRYSVLAAATEEQLQALQTVDHQRKRCKLERRQLDRWLRGLKGKSLWGTASTPPWFLALSSGRGDFAKPIQQLWPVMPGEMAHEGKLQAFESLEIKILHANIALEDTAGGKPNYWRMLARRCGKIRRSVPFQGVVCLLERADIQEQASLQRFGYVLQSVLAEAQGRLPVYLVVSDLESLPGFEEFASALSPSEQQQLFGISLPLEGEGPRSVVVVESLGDLQKRLEALLTRVLYQERQLERRKSLVRFPAQFETFCSQLADALSFCLPTSKNLVMRGIHFIGLRKDASGPYPQIFDGAVRETSGAWMFAQRWWQDFLQADRGLAVPGTVWLRRQWLVRMVVGTVSLFVFSAIALWQVQSFREGQKQLEDLQQTLSRHASSVEQGRASSPQDVLSLVHLWTDAMARHSERAQYRQWPGLSLGNQLDEELSDYRLRLHKDSVLPLIRDRVESVLRLSSDNPENLMTALKIYLMLAQPEHRDVKMVAQWYREQMSEEFSAKGLRAEWVEGRVEEALGADQRVLDLDEALVAKTREHLNRIPREQQLYLRIKQIARYRNLGDFQFASNLGYEVAEAFEGGFFVVPGLYTLKGYTQVFEPELNRLLTEYGEERWILGAAAENPSGEDLPRLRAAVQRAYADDYIRYWQTGLSQLRLVHAHNLDHLLALLSTLTGPSSPMRMTLQAAAEQTNYSLSAAGEKVAEQTAIASAVGGTAARVAKKIDKVGKVAAALESEDSGLSHLALIRERFKEIHRLVRKEDGQQAAIESLIVQLSELQQYLVPLSLGNQRESAYRATIKRFKSDGADVLGQARLATRQLPEPMRSWMLDLTEQAWSMMLQETQLYIGDAYAAEVKPFYDSHLNRRYPLFKDAKQEASFEQFSEFFRPKGIEERFFQEYLSPFVEAGRSRWVTRKIDGRGVGLDQDALDQFRRAQRIRAGLFGGKPDLKVKVVVKPLFLDANVSRFELRLDDQRMNYRHGPQRPVHIEWPSNSTAPGIGVAFEDYNGLLAKRSFEGIWSLPRLIEQFELQSEQSGGPYQLGYELDGRRVVYSLQGGSDLQVFIQRELQQYRLRDVLGG